MRDAPQIGPDMSPTRENVFKYLDELRESGVTATPDPKLEGLLQELVEAAMGIAEISEGGIIFHYRDPKFRAAREAVREYVEEVKEEAYNRGFSDA